MVCVVPIPGVDMFVRIVPAVSACADDADTTCTIATLL